MSSFSSPASSSARRNDCASSIIALRSGVTGPSDSPTPTTHTCRCTAAEAIGWLNSVRLADQVTGRCLRRSMSSINAPRPTANAPTSANAPLVLPVRGNVAAAGATVVTGAAVVDDACCTTATVVVVGGDRGGRSRRRGRP